MLRFPAVILELRGGLALAGALQGALDIHVFRFHGAALQRRQLQDHFRELLAYCHGIAHQQRSFGKFNAAPQRRLHDGGQVRPRFDGSDRRDGLPKRNPLRFRERDPQLLLHRGGNGVAAIVVGGDGVLRRAGDFGLAQVQHRPQDEPVHRQPYDHERRQADGGGLCHLRPSAAAQAHFPQLHAGQAQDEQSDPQIHPEAKGGGGVGLDRDGKIFRD